ncbi:MAG: hypothetical protein JWM95_892 [Gemmatimonadetes bacterium]|nr:hypothetical protein [Gemmatimonadota bacterium]
MKILFAMPYLPRAVVSALAVAAGKESLSGSQSSILLVADELATRGHTVGLWVHGGQRVSDTGTHAFATLEEALAEPWDQIVLGSWEDAGTFDALRAAGVAPILWTQVPVPRETLLKLEQGLVRGIVVVSDTSRLTLLHSARASRIGRVYNPLHPYFARNETRDASSYESRRVVFTGLLGETKGAHLVLKMWPHVRRLVPDATLTMVGSAKLYRSDIELGPLGLASPEFEAKYVKPVIDQFGTLAAAGIELTGLLNPAQLKHLYGSCALGFINFNWYDYTETFCCVGAEMLACGLPLFSVAAGALPETMGRSGGALLAATPDIGVGAEMVARLLTNSGELVRMGSEGRRFVLSEYALSAIADEWERLLARGPAELSSATGAWKAGRPARYYLERLVAITRSASPYRAIGRLVRGR